MSSTNNSASCVRSELAHHMNLKDKLNKPDLKREELFSLYLDLLKERFPQHQLDFHPPDSVEIKTPDNRTFTIYMENMWLQCRNASEPRIDILERYLRSWASIMEPEPPLTKENIIPIVKDDEYLNVGGAKPSFVHDHLVGDLWILYAVDLPHATASLTLRNSTS